MLHYNTSLRHHPVLCALLAASLAGGQAPFLANSAWAYESGDEAISGFENTALEPASDQLESGAEDLSERYDANPVNETNGGVDGAFISDPVSAEQSASVAHDSAFKQSAVQEVDSLEPLTSGIQDTPKKDVEKTDEPVITMQESGATDEDPAYTDSYGCKWTFTVSDGVATITAVDIGSSTILKVPSAEDLRTKDESVTKVVCKVKLAQDGITEIIVPSGVTVQLGQDKKGYYNTGSTTLNKVTIGDDCVFLNSKGVVNANAGFGSSSVLTSVSVGKNLQATALFKDCVELVTANVKSLCENMFSGCKKLTDLTVDSSVTKLPDYVFRNTAITSYDFSSVAEVGKDAFNGSKLSGEINIPSTVKSVASGAFQNCGEITKIIFDCEEITGANVLKKNTNLALVMLGSNVKKLFYNTSTSSSAAGMFNLADSVDISVDEGNPFFSIVEADGKKYLVDKDGLQYVPFVQGLPTYINSSNQHRFKDANTDVLTIPANVTTIDGDGLGFADVVVDPGNTTFITKDGVLYSADMKTLYKAKGGLEEFEIPAGVETIAPGAFAAQRNLTKVTIPEGVTTIGRRAFQGCSGLETVELPTGLLVINDEAFSHCSSLSFLSLPETLSHIGNGAFEGTSMVALSIPEGLWADVGIDMSGFVEDGGVPTINSLFYGLSYGASSLFGATSTQLSTLDLSAYQGRVLPHYVFAGLNGITEVTIPSSVLLVGSGVFYECRNLNSVYCYAPASLFINTTGSGHGDSGSGVKEESYATTAPGSFSLWNPDIESDGLGIGSKFQDRTGITFYGSAYNEELVSYCNGYGQTFIPIVALQTLSGADNPFWNKTLASSFAIDYGEGMTDYDYVTIADIDKGGTPQVVAKFGAYSGTRDLTDDAACTIVYYDPDGNVVTSFDKDGVYTASLVGDGKSVFGARMVKFNVGTVEEPAAEEPGDSKPDDNASETPVTDNANAGTSNTARATTQAASQGVRTVYQTTYAPAANAVQSVESGDSNTYAVGDTALSTALQGIAGTDGSVLVWGGSNAASPQYVWEVPGTRLTAADIATIDFAVTDASKDAAVAGLVGDADFTAFTVKQAGSFPATYKLHWKTSSTFYDGAKVDVYRVVAASGATGSASESAFVEKAYAADGDKSLELVKSGVVATDGYVTVDVDRGGTYVLVESGADVGLPLVEKAYADTGEIVAVDVDEGAQQTSNWMMPAAVTAVAAAVVGACGGWFARGRRQDAGTEQTSGQKR